MEKTVHVSCPECGFQGEVGAKDWSPHRIRCKCGLGILTKSSLLGLPPGDNNHDHPISELPPEPKQEDIRTGKERVLELANQGKGLGEIMNILEGVVAPQTVRAYFKHVSPPKSEILPKVTEKFTKKFTTKKSGLKHGPHTDSGRREVYRLKDEGKSYDDVSELLKGRLAPSSIRTYWDEHKKNPGNSTQDKKAKFEKLVTDRKLTGQIVTSAKLRSLLVEVGYSRTTAPVDAATTREMAKELPNGNWKITAGQSRSPVELSKSVDLESMHITLINRDALIERVKELRKDFKSSTPDSFREGIIAGLNIILRTLEFMKGEFYIVNK